MDDKRKALYDALSGEYNLGSYEEFTEKLNDENKRKALYDAAGQDYNLGTYEEYSAKLGFEPNAIKEDNAAVDGSVPMFDDEPQAVPAAENLEENSRKLRGLWANFKESSKGLWAGLKGYAGEQLNMFSGSSREEQAALNDIEQLEQQGIDVTQYLADKEKAEFQKAYGMSKEEFMALDKKERKELIDQATDRVVAQQPILDEARLKEQIRQQTNRKSVEDAFRKALEAAGGDMTKAKAILREQAADKTKGDVLIEEATETMSNLREPEGFAGWVGNLLPQMIPATATLALNYLTKGKASGLSKAIGFGTMGGLTLSTAGMSMIEARNAGATNLEVWLTGIADGAIEIISEKIPFDRVTKRVFSSAKANVAKKLGDAVLNPKGRAELEKLLSDANEKLGGRLFSKKNVGEWLKDTAYEAAGEFTAEALQTITTMIYENPEDYPTISEVLANGWEGAKAGLFMGAITGGASHAAAHSMNKDRRMAQGYVDVAQMENEDGDVEVVEVVGEDPQTGNITILHNDELESVSREKIGDRFRFSYEEFENARLRQMEDEAIESGNVTEGQIQGLEDNIARDIDEIKALAPEMTESEISAVLQSEMAVDPDTPLGEAVAKYQEDVARHGELVAAKREADAAKKEAIRTEIETAVGQRFWVQESGEDDGSGIVPVSETVEEVVYADGRVGYVVGSDESGNLTMVYTDGTKGFSSRAEITEKENSGEILSNTVMGLDDYLAVKMDIDEVTREKARMQEEHALSVEEMIATHPQGSVINVGTEEAKIEVPVIAPPTKDGVIVQMPDGTTPMLTWEDVAHAEKKEITPKTNAQLNQSIVDEYRVAYTPAVPAASQTAQQKEEQVKRTSPANPLPLKADGTVDQTALWNKDPEGWAKWNDEKRQDGGADSLAYVTNAIAIEQAKMAELQAVRSQETDFDRRDALDAEIATAQERIDRLVAIQQGYLAQPAVADAVQNVQPEPEPQTEEERAAVEEQRREPFRKRAKELGDKLGVKVHIAETLADVREEQPREAIMRAEVTGSKDRYPGWYNRDTGEVTIYLPHVASVTEVDKTLIHEIVAHKGLRGLLGKEGYNVLCDAVWDMMTEAERAKYMAYPGVNGDKRLAADEYIARFAEGLDLEQSRPIWNKIAEAVQKILNSMGIRLEVTKEDLADLIAASYMRLQEQARAAQTENAPVVEEVTEEIVPETTIEQQAEIEAGVEADIEEVTEESTSPIIAAAQQDKGGISFNVTTEEPLQDKIRKFAQTEEGKATGWTEDDIESIIAETESLIDAIHRSSTGNEFYDEFAYKEPTIRVDWRDGEAKPIVTWTRANIEYKYDMSADLLCINNEGLEAVLSSDKMVALMEMFVPEKKAKKGEPEIKFTSEDYLELYNTLKDLGFVVPCKGCFDAAGRFKMLPSVAQKFAAEVNALIDERNKDPKAFDEKLKAKPGEKTVGGLPATAATKSAAIAAGVAGDNLTEHVKWTQLMSADGQTKMLSDWGGIFRAWQRTGAGRPKDKLLPEPYYGDIVSSVSTIIGKYGEKTPSFRDTLVNQGTGLRRNSHSEFRPVLAIDEIQFMRDAFIRNLTVFKYMKELDDVRLFGKMGVKFNMSFFPEYVPGTKVAGLDKDGNYIASEESVGSREFPYQGEDGKRHYDGMKGWEEAQKHINKDVSLSSVIFSIPHLLKALTDVPTPSDMRGIWGSLIPFHSSGATTASLAMQGLGMARANGVGHGFSEAFYDYGKGVTNFEAVQNDRFGEGWHIVSGTKAGTDVEPGHKLEFVNGNHYYNKGLGVHLFASGYILDSELPAGVIGENGELDITNDQKKDLMHKFTIDYNDKVRELKGPYAYKDAADFYIAELPKLGLIPRFDFEVSEEKFLEMCEAANVDPRHPKLGWKGEGNSWSPIDSEAYYSLFCDYGMTDPATGEWAPHMPVGYVNEEGEREFRLPENAVEIVKEGLDRFSEVRRSENARIDEAIEAFAERSVEKGRISQKSVDKVLGKKPVPAKPAKPKKPGVIDLVEEAKKAVEKTSNISFSFIGERGAANDKTLEGVARLDNLEVARQMESQFNPDWSAKENEAALKIKIATGWERGADGKWRYEVEDVKTKPAREWLTSKKKLTLKDIVEPNPIFDLYPDLLDINIVKDRSKYNLGAYYSEAENAIKLPVGALKEEYTAMMDYYGEEKTDGNFARYWKVMESDILHELQHAIQHREGFAQGGSPDSMFPEDQKRYNELYDEMSLLIDEYNKIPYYDRLMAYAVDARKEAERAKIRVSNFQKAHQIGDYVYKRLAGEVEARNASKRRDLSPEERRNTLLASTEDVARKDQIFLMDAVAGDAQNNISFRMRTEEETPLEFQESVLEEFKKEYRLPSPTTVVDMYDRDAVAIALGYAPEEFTDAQYNYIMKGYQNGGEAIFDKETKRSVIFAKETMDESWKVYDSIFHENTHMLVDKHPELLELGEWLWQNSEPLIRRKIKETILASDTYKGQETDEMLSGYTGVIMAIGKADVAYSKTPEELRKHWDLIFNAFGYERKTEDNLRRRGTGDNSGRVESSRTGAEASAEQKHNDAAKQELSAEERRVIGEYFPEFNKSEDVRMKVNSQGKDLTEGQKEFFANSKAVDKDGNLLVLYHGTPRAGFTEFKSGWFTTSKEDAISYSGDRKGRLFDPNEKYEPETLTAGDFPLGYMTFDSEEDRASFLAEHPSAESAMSRRDFDSMTMQAEDEEYDALIERKPELQKIWNAYREYERERFVDTTIDELLDNPDAYTEDDFRRAILAYDSNAIFDEIDEIEDSAERKDALVEALEYMKNDAAENGGFIGDMKVATRIPRNGEGVSHNDSNARTYEAYINIEHPLELDAAGRHSEFESGDIYKAVEEALSDEQYDGVIIRNWRVGRYQQLGDVVVPKNGSQIKLTSNENPTKSHNVSFRATSETAREILDAYEYGSGESLVQDVENALNDGSIDSDRLRDLVSAYRKEQEEGYERGDRFVETEDYVERMVDELESIAADRPSRTFAESSSKFQDEVNRLKRELKEKYGDKDMDEWSKEDYDTYIKAIGKLVSSLSGKGGVSFRTSLELDEEFGDAWRNQQNEDGRHSTQVANTKSTYEKIGRYLEDAGMKGASILDASSGLGLGTQALREMGFQVDDVEPFPSENREAPTFSSYADIDKQYDVVISNAVLNVIPDDWRADVLHQMADAVKEGGKMIINTRPASNIAQQGVEGKTRITLDSPSEILVKRGDRIAAYQKGFTSEELAEWIKSELGEGWKVEKATKKNSGISGEGTAVVIKEGDNVSFRVTGTPTDEVVANGLTLSPAQTAEVAANIFAALPEESREKITDGLNGNILGLQDAIMQIPASLATKENWNEEDRAMADVVAEEMTKMAGEMTRPFSAPEALWLLYNNLNKGNDLISQASRALVQRNLGFDEETLERQEEAKQGVSFRMVGDATANAKASMYNRGAVNVWTRLKESFVDMQASVEELVSAIEKATGKVAKGFENILLALNQQSSKGLAAMESYEQRFLMPMFDEVREIMDKAYAGYNTVVRYVILKHGLERNKKLAQRDAKAHYQEIYDEMIAKVNSMDDRQKRTYLTNAQLQDADAKAKLATLKAADTSAFTEEEKNAHKKELAKAKEEAKKAKENLERAQKINSMSEQELKDELDKVFEKIENGTDSVYKELRKNDYSGISSMFYDQLGVNRKDYSTEEEYQAALMLAKNDRFSSLEEVEEQAEGEVSSFEGRVDTKELWKRINAATKETLRQQYEANMISKDQYESLRNMFEYYVPLRGFKDNTAEDMYTYYRKPNSTGYTKPILGAEGRKTEAESPFGWIAAMAGSAIASNVKNEAKLALYYFVSNRPDNGIATLSRTWFVHTPGDVDANGKKIFKPAYPPFSEDLSSDAAKQAYEDWQEQMRELQKQGLAYEAGQRLNLGNAVVNISDANKPEHVVTVKVAGKDYTIVINGNPRAAQAINGELNLEGTADDYSAIFGPVLRWMSSVNTSYNPEFWITNLMRDMAFTWMAVNTKEDPAYRKKFSKNYWKCFRVIGLVAKNEKGTIGNSYIEDMYKDFVKYGGVTGYTQIKDSETWEKEIDNYLRSTSPESLKNGRMMRGMKTFFHAAHRFGESLEQVSRFAAFLTSREMGKTINEAIADAKEITVNFNRKGSGKMISLEESKYLTDKNGQPLSLPARWAAVGLSSIAPLGRRTIMFFNAAVQGLNSVYRLWKKNPRRLAGWTAAYFAVGVMNAVLHALLDDDDDYLDIPQYERRNSLMLGGNGAYLKWALPQEARAFYALGDLAVETVLGRNPHQNIIGESLKIATEVLPVNPAEGWKAFVPSVAIPAVELMLNEDYKGAPIYNEQKWLSEEERKRTAKWSSAYQGTGAMYKGIAQGLNYVTGGDKHDAGKINLQPEKMEYIVQSAFGGTIRTADKFINTIWAMFDPEEDVTVRQTPFLNRILTLNDERFKNVHVNEVFDYYKADADHALTLEKRYTKDRDMESLNELRKSEEYQWAKVYRRYKKALDNLKEKLKVAEGTAEKKELMRQQDELKRRVIKEISEL